MYMSTPIETTFVLTGAMAGRTITLGTRAFPYSFTHGKLHMTGPAEEVALHARFLERNWQAYPEGHPNLKRVKNGQRNVSSKTVKNQQPVVSGDIQPNGKGIEARESEINGSGSGEDSTGESRSVPAGNGQSAELSEAETVKIEVNQKLLKAVQGLDAGEDANWTRDGRPAMAAVERAYGASDVTRADIEAVSPGYTRDQAHKIQTTD